MNDLPLGPRGQDSNPPPPRTAGSDYDPGRSELRRLVSPPRAGVGTAIAMFFGLMTLFILAAAVAQFAVRGNGGAAPNAVSSERKVPEAPPAPPVLQDRTPAQPSPPADGNPAGNTSREAVTP